MAVTVLAQPTSPNVTGTKLVYSLSSSLAPSPQYQFAVDIKLSGSQDTLSRIFSYPNNFGSGIVEISQILGDNVSYDNDWKTTISTAALETFQDFTLHFSESYGTSISSSTVVYPGGATADIRVFPGTVDPNAGSYNFPSGSYPGNQLLTNFPFVITPSFEFYKTDDFKNVKTTDYETISVSYGTSSLNTVTWSTYDANGSFLTANGISGFGEEFYNIPAGPQNFIDKGAPFTTQFENPLWQYYSADLTLSNGDKKTYWYKRNDKCLLDGESVRFAFINNFGFFDYYNIYNPIKQVTALDRSDYTKPMVDYSSELSTYDITNRGLSQYNISFDDKYRVSTDYINKDTSDWLTEMLDSGEVYIQEGTDFIPVILTNKQYTWQLTNNREKIFKFEIEYQFANQRYDR